MKLDSSFNRNKPLFERKCVPFEFFECSDENRNIFCERGSQKRKIKFTLRLLQGHRRISSGNQATERVIRLEISDEHRKCENLSLVSSDKQVEDQLGHSFFRSPKPLISGSSTLNSSSLIRFPVLQDRSNFESKDVNKDHVAKIDSYDESAFVKDKTLVNIYELEVGESDFAKLQQDQALLVDFGSFSSSIIDLLNLCDLGDHEDFQSNKSSTLQSGNKSQTFNGSNFFCRIEDFSPANSSQIQNSRSSSHKGGKASARFSIVESNQFRELIHLSLNIQPGSDESVRAYLSERLSDLLAQTNMLNFQLRFEKDRAIAAESTCAEMTKQYHEMIQMSETEKINLVQKADASIQKESMKRCEELQLIKRMNEEEIHTLKEANQEMRKSLQQQIGSYDSENRQLILSLEDKDKQLKKVEKQLIDSKSNEDNALKSRSQMESELSVIRKEHSCLSNELGIVKGHLSTMEMSNRELEEKLHQSNKDLHEIQKESALLRNIAEDKNQRLNIMEQEVVKLKAENDQAKELLTRYQRDRIEMKRKQKEKNDRIKELEDASSAKERIVGEINKHLDEKDVKIKQLEKELRESTIAFEKIAKELDEKQKTLSSNQQVIAWLNKEAKVKPTYNIRPNTMVGANFSSHSQEYAVPIPTVNRNKLNQLSPAQYITPESFKGPRRLSQVQSSTLQPSHSTNRVVNVPVYIKTTPMKVKEIPLQPARPNSSASVVSLPRQNTPPVAIPQPNKVLHVPPTI